MKLFASVGLLCLLLTAAARADDIFQHPPFGQIYAYAPEKPVTAQLILMASGDGGWRGAVLPIAEYLKNRNCLVAGFDIRQYFNHLKQRNVDCYDLAEDFSELAQFLREKYNMPADQKPLLIGYSSGATLVYGTIVEASPGEYLGAISFGFCPDLPLRKPFCAGNGLESVSGRGGAELWLLPAKNLQTPWYAFQGLTDQVCDQEKTEEYVSKVPIGKFILLPKVGHGFRKTQNWIYQFDEVLKELNGKNAKTG